MSDKDLQQKYSKLKEDLETLKVSKVKAQTTIETLESRKDELEAEIKELTKTDNMDDAMKKFSLVKKTLDELLEEAEALVSDSE